jgi:hypothetical protein
MKKLEVVSTYVVKKTFIVEVEDDYKEEELDTLIYDDKVSTEKDYWESTETISSVKEYIGELTISEDDWFKEYQPIEEEDGLYKTFDKSSFSDLEKLAKSFSNTTEWMKHVWTSVDGDDGDIYITNGLTYVNQINFYVTKKPWKDTALISVLLEDIE